MLNVNSPVRFTAWIGVLIAIVSSCNSTKKNVTQTTALSPQYCGGSYDKEPHHNGQIIVDLKFYKNDTADLKKPVLFTNAIDSTLTDRKLYQQLINTIKYPRQLIELGIEGKIIYMISFRNYRPEECVNVKSFEGSKTFTMEVERSLGKVFFKSGLRCMNHKRFDVAIVIDAKIISG